MANALFGSGWPKNNNKCNWFSIKLRKQDANVGSRCSFSSIPAI